MNKTKRWLLSPEVLIWFQIYYNIFVKFFIHDLGLPSALNYVTDVITLLMICHLLNRLHFHHNIELHLLLIILLMIIYIAGGIISVFYNRSELLLLLWSIRNVGRFFVWFICVAVFMKPDNLEKHFRVMERIMVINFFLMLFQYIFLGYRSDYLNGIFGHYVGGNSAVNTFAVILTIENVAYFFLRKRKIKEISLNIFFLCISCALNEIKFYFVELVVIVLTMVIFQLKRRMKRRIAGICISLFAFANASAVAGYQILSVFYPGFKNFFQKDVFFNYLTRSYNSHTVIYHNGIPVMNRFTAFGIIKNNFLETMFQQAFGIGMGAGDYSSFFGGWFYQQYGETAYNGFLFPYILLENGIIGLFIFITIYLYIIYISTKKYNKKIYQEYALISGTTAVLGLMICIYNSALRIESSGYLFYTVLALTFIKFSKGTYYAKTNH